MNQIENIKAMPKQVILEKISKIGKSLTGRIKKKMRGNTNYQHQR